MPLHPHASSLIPPAAAPVPLPESIRLPEVISALSFALDLVEGQPQGHAVRTCLLGMRLAREVGMPREGLRDLFYALLLKDVGCSSNSSRICALLEADDRAASGDLRTTDWCELPESASRVMPCGSPAGALRDSMSVFTRDSAAAALEARELVRMRCERGAAIVRELGLSRATADAVRSLDEHFDGRGHPEGLAGDSIPLAARIVGLAQTIEVFHARFGQLAALEVARQRRGTWFDPQLVAALDSMQRDERFWRDYNEPDPRLALSAYEPEERSLLADPDQLDRTARAFAKVIDAKSPWTYFHSEGVAAVAGGIAEVMGLPPEQVRELRRAGLLHDIGKLGVSNLILDKPGPLTHQEMISMRRHTAYTHSILERVGAFRSLAELAASHHERLDGSGYHRGVGADQLSVPARILCVSDMYEALAARRPYREDPTEDEVFDILNRHAGTGICPEVLSALTEFLARTGFTPIRLAA